MWLAKDCEMMSERSKKVLQRISVITVNYNNLRGLRRTMESVMAQTYTELEYLVVDGGSTDGSVGLIRQYADRLSYWVSEKDGGIYDAMNKGLAKATGEYCIFLNSGDSFCHPSTIMDVFGHGNRMADLLVGRQKFLSDKGEISISPKLRLEELDICYFLSSTLPHQATFIKRALLQELGGYDVSYPVSADWVFWIKAVVESRCKVQMTPYAVSYMEEGGTSSDMDKCHRDMEKYLSDCLERGVLRWDDIFKVALKGRAYELATRSLLQRFVAKVLVWIGKYR